MITVKDMVKQHLEQNGYDGLAGKECGCEKDDLFPCSSEGMVSCVAGHKKPCPCTAWQLSRPYVGAWCMVAGKKESTRGDK